MSDKAFFFAGGGTGGHIYPALAVAEQIIKLDGQSKIHFFCSGREIDSKILSKTNFPFTALPAKGLSLRPDRFIAFCKTFLQSSKITKEILRKTSNPSVVGVGGFVAGPVCWAAHKMKLPVALINVDIVPGKANKLIGRFADRIFLQFEDTKEHFRTKAQMEVVGCPLRGNFRQPNPEKIKSDLGLDKTKNILLITGASSGSQSINDTICKLLEKLGDYSESWQIVHITGIANYEQVKKSFVQSGSKLKYTILDYCDNMPDLLSASDLVIGRSGAVSVAEYAAASVPSVCMPYPHHKDLHQYLNAAKLVEAGAAIVVDDLPDAQERMEWLWEELEELLKDNHKLEEMKENCRQIAKKNAATVIAKKLLGIESQ
jgi:UDP-N-acetylglucosamine--N-acetylmuramyl-(pentapeptide) pyrophosphoryl-undecaprenol N-acetylglucosamine transferase